MGRFNSSLTRVRPFFRLLIQRDPTGTSWLSSLLSLAGSRQNIPADLLQNPGSLRITNLDKEGRLDPPEEFLRWLIHNPEEMTWPDHGRRRFGNETQLWREMLMCRRDLSGEPADRHTDIRKSDREKAIYESARQPATYGSVGSSRKWWGIRGPHCS